MQLPSDVAAVAIVVAIVALCGMSLLVVGASGSNGVGECASWLLAWGAALSTVGLLVALFALVEHSAEVFWHRDSDATLVNLVAVLLAVGGVLLVAGMLRMPGATDSTSEALRLALDGLVIATALWFVGWVLLAEPTRLLGDATPTACAAILTTSVTAAGAFGVGVIVVLRSSPPRAGLILAACGALSVSGAGLGLTTAVCQGLVDVGLSSAIALSVGLLMIAVGGRFADANAVDSDLIRRGTGYAFLPMLAMATSAFYHLLREGQFTSAAVISSSVEGFALVARQWVALRDVRGYANRLIEREAHFRELAHTDPLTGLANRRGLLRALHQVDPAEAPCVLLGLDLDGFKNVNDMRGHDVGDAVLVDVGRRLRSCLGSEDVAARLGGDEFAVLLRVDLPAAEGIAERILSVLGRPYERPEGRIFLSTSIGVADHPGQLDVETLLRHADLALRYAKQRGKNRVERYDVAYDRTLRRRTTIEHELRGAIERDELHLAFQPVVSLPSVRPVGAEALLRWHHPELGSVRPDEFIPLAEECGMIAELGAWVLQQACHQLSLWLLDGHDVWLSVNVSPRELHAPEYVVQVADALRAHRVPPQRLVLEITEHAVATDLDELIRRLAALRLTGVRIALDDFGAGYSSLGQLRRLPIDILKIDHSLVTEPEPVRPGGREGMVFAPMVDVVMRLGHQLGLEVIAEGVTNQNELAAVVGAGCRFGQGQLFGWGVPAEHLEAMLDAATKPVGSLGRPDGSTRGRSAADGGTRPGAATPVRPGPQPRYDVWLGDVPVTGSELGGRSASAHRSGTGSTPPVQDVRSVDSGREMRQA